MAASPATSPTTPRDDTPPRSLGRRLVLATLVFCIVFTVAAVAVRTWSAWQRNLAAMTAELGLIDRVFQRTLSKAIWEMDREEMLTHVDGVAQVSPVGRVELRIRRAGRTAEVLERRQDGAPVSSLAPSLHRQLSYEPYAGASETVGELTLEGDERVLWSRLRGEIVGIVLTQLVQSVLLAGLIMWLFHVMVTVHVRRIARHLEEVTPITLDQTLRLDRTVRHRDELSLLEGGINQLQAKLSEHLARQLRDERDLAAHRDRLADLVNEQTAELRAANAQLEELSRSDPLTGLANRRHFDEVKDIEFRRAQRMAQPLSVLLCDVDFFKRYNDTYGHALGDVCLKDVADTLRQTFARAGELIARIGGEEFAVLLPGMDAEQARQAAERLRQALAVRALPHSGSQISPHITMSIGLAQFDPATMDRFDTLLDQADRALYRAKSQGRNQVATAG
ncbi:MAG TPA: GGDEF domain-containing protein [Rhizobacter sp.]|nr:GGDEF domain-containing protein [Rhizobacter sp.]